MNVYRRLNADYYYRLNADYELPESFTDFEKLAGRLVGAEYKVTMMRPHKRHGQPQQGVDYYGRDASGAWIGVQAKLRSGSRVLSCPDVTREIEKAEGFEHRLSQYFIVTSTPYNANLHKFIDDCSRRRVKRGNFSVRIYFWAYVKHLLDKHHEVARELGYSKLRRCHRGGLFMLNCG